MKNKEKLYINLIWIGLVLHCGSDIIFTLSYINYTANVVIKILLWIFIGYCFYKYFKEHNKK